MRIEIDTKEDLHNIHHIIRLLSAISGSMRGKDSFKFNDDLFSESSSTPSQSTPPSDGTGLFNMFDSSPSSSSSTPSSDSSVSPYGIPSVFDEKKNDDHKDFLDSLQVY